MVKNWYTSWAATPLAGARIWLSGAMPEGSSRAQQEEIGAFLRQFARQVFLRGGHIVHGSHPTFTPILLEVADSFQREGGRKDCLTLAISRFWSKQLVDEINRWRSIALVYQTPELPGENAREASLEVLRNWMATRADAVVLLAGNWWQERIANAGVPAELQLAVERGLPSFLLAGFGGAAQAFLDQNPNVLARLKNGISTEENRNLSSRNDVANLAPTICNQLERLPLVRGRGADGSSFRILALDGGGLRGTFTASVLAAWEKQTKQNLVEHFDLVAGTSTGGILAIGLGMGLSAKNMLDFYRMRGPIIFPITHLRSRLRHHLRHWFSPKYSQEVLLRELGQVYLRNGKPPALKDSLCRLVIPTYHATAGGSHVFRTPHHPDLTGDADTSAAHAALATAAAPSYFTAARVANMVAEGHFFDGGVWANAPALAAVVEAVCFLRVPLERIDLLSIGTTEEPLRASKEIRAGLLGWIWRKKILNLLMNVQQESSLRLARHLVTDPKFLRVNRVTVPGSYTLDSPLEIEELASLGEKVALESETIGQIKSRFVNGVPALDWDKYS